MLKLNTVLMDPHNALIGSDCWIDALTDNFNPVTGRRLFNFAGMLHLLALTGGMQDIKQEHRRQIRDWIHDAAQDEGEDEEGYEYV